MVEDDQLGCREADQEEETPAGCKSKENFLRSSLAKPSPGWMARMMEQDGVREQEGWEREEENGCNKAKERMQPIETYLKA